MSVTRDSPVINISTKAMDNLQLTLSFRLIEMPPE